MGNGVLRVVTFKIHFLTCVSSNHNKISMANANIVALYAGSLRLKIAYFSPKKFTFYKWCETKVAHCIAGGYTLPALYTQKKKLSQYNLCFLIKSTITGYIIVKLYT